MSKGAITAVKPPVTPMQERDSRIPPDLITGVDAFKREVLGNKRV